MGHGQEKNGRRSSLQYLENAFNLLKHGEFVHRFETKTNKKQKRCRKRLSQLLHTHVALIAVCVLSALDASCVLGQIICDILIMTEKQHASDVVQQETVVLLQKLCPNELNHTDPDHQDHEMTLKDILELLKDGATCSQNAHSVAHNAHAHDPPDFEIPDIHQQRVNINGNTFAKSRNYINSKKGNLVRNEFGGQRNLRHIVKHRSKRAAAHGDVEYGILYELTHVFHLGSMVILSLLLLETFLKIFAMGQKFLHHKLEVFDAFVVTVSWCLDVGFWEGLWHQPGTEAATILIIILPWRVIRIVNSFVLVIQEKDLVMLKLMKQQYRILLKKGREMKSKLEIYRIENRQFQGLCRKHDATEAEIQACMGQNRKPRRSSIVPAFSSFASLAMLGAVGSVPDLKKDSSDEEEEDIENLSKTKDGRKVDAMFRSMSIDSGISNVNFSLSPDPLDSAGIGSDNSAFSFDNTSLPAYDDILSQGLDPGSYTRL